MMWPTVAEPPRKLVLETTQTCQLKCLYCPTGLGILNRPNLMDVGLFDKIVKDVSWHVRHVYIEFMGEPLLHPQIGYMIDRIDEFATTDLATNGILAKGEVLLDLAKVTTLSVTICGLRENYAKIHGVDRYDEAMRGLRNLVDIRSGNVFWTWLVLKDNEHQFEEAREYCQEIGAIWHPKGVALGVFSRDHAPTTPGQHNRYENGSLIYDRRRCPEFWEVAYICSDGSVAFCGFDWAAIDSPGNVWDREFIEIWNNAAFREARRNHLDGKLHPVCRFFCGCPWDRGRDNLPLGERGYIT